MDIAQKITKLIHEHTRPPYKLEKLFVKRETFDELLKWIEETQREKPNAVIGPISSPYIADDNVLFHGVYICAYCTCPTCEPTNKTETPVYVEPTKSS